MSTGDKTKDIINILDRETNVVPRARPANTKISTVEYLPWETTFSAFNEKHVRVASQLMKILLAAKDFDEYLAILDEVREFENDGLFLFTLYSSVKHRSDTQGVVLPPIEERAPHLFFAAETIHKAIQLAIHQPDGDFTVVNERTADVTDNEGRLAYFREDIGMNRHHWAWHVVFPNDEEALGKPKDRKGELFYYMHQQMLARYDCERLSNYMNRVAPLVNFQQALDPYFPHLTSQVTGVHFSARPHELRMQNIDGVTVQDLEVWRYRILDAIDLGYLRTAAGKKLSLSNENGIDLLGSVLEASSASVNRSFYGNLHNQGHNLISSCHDPETRYRMYPGVMGFSESAARDPIFYRWHRYIDNIFVRYKNTLAPYTREELSFDGIKVMEAEIKMRNTTSPNVLQTFMREARSDLSHAPFLKTKGKILVTYEHLDHEPFNFSFKILNNTKHHKDVTIRVFLAPKTDLDGTPFTANEQRRLMIELDKIKERLQPGINTITRFENDSSVTLAENIRSFRSLKNGTSSADEPQIDYCSCGWPQHLLIPRGRSNGMDFNLFVMVTDYNKDKVSGEDGTEPKGSTSYCGSRDAKYPDSRPMGFPFDRRLLTEDGREISTMAEFLTNNMFMRDVKITFSNEVRPMTEWISNMYVKN